MTGVDDLAAAVKGPRDMGRDVTGYTGKIVSISAREELGVMTGISAVVAVGSDQWIITNMAGPFLNEIANSGAPSLAGRNVRVHMVNGQPEIAYTVDPATTVAVAGAVATVAAVPPPPAGVWKSLTQTNINIDGVLGCTTNWAWYVSSSYMCEMRFFFNAPSSFPAINYLSVPSPGTSGLIPVPLTSPLITAGKHGAAIMNSVPVTVRMDPGGQVFVFQNNNPSGAAFVEGSMSYQTAAS